MSPARSAPEGIVSSRRTRRAAAVIGVLALLNGCLQVRQGVTLLPNGSGKVDLKISMKPSTLKKLREMIEKAAAKKGAPVPEDDGGLNLLGTRAEGIVAWTHTTAENDGEMAVMTSTAYFEDVSKVIFRRSSTDGTGNREERVALSFAYAAGASESSLSVTSCFGEQVKKILDSGASLQKEPRETRDRTLRLLGSMLADLKISLTVTVPGKITRVSGLDQLSDRSAGLSVDGTLWVEAIRTPDGESARKVRLLSEATEATVSWTPVELPEGEAKAFADELAEAKRKWKARSEERPPKSSPPFKEK